MTKEERELLGVIGAALAICLTLIGIWFIVIGIDGVFDSKFAILAKWSKRPALFIMGVMCVCVGQFGFQIALGIIDPSPFDPSLFMLVHQFLGI